MTAPVPSRRRLPAWVLALWVLVGGLAALLGLFFFLLNDAWIPIRLPLAPPWSEGPASEAYEAHFAALVLIPLGLGAVAAALVGRRIVAVHRRRAAECLERANRLENEIEKVSRLLSSARGGNIAEP